MAAFPSPFHADRTETRCFFIKSMDRAGGDAKKVVADLAAALAGGRGHEVTLASFDCPHDEGLFKLGSAVRPERLSIGDVNRQSGPRKVGRDILIVASEHADYEQWCWRRVQYLAICFSIPFFAAMTAISVAVIPCYLPAVLRSVVTVANPVSFALRGRRPAQGGARRLILSVGRADQAQNYSTLISVIAALAPRHPDRDVRIVGQGELRVPLEQQVAELELAERIALPALIREIDAEYRSAGLYVGPLLAEVFGRLLAERA